jgi:hypothetical protein
MRLVGLSILELKSIATSYSRYVAAGATVAGLAVLVSPHIGVAPEYCGVAGFVLPLGPLTWWFNRASAVRSELERWQGWQAAGLITHDDVKRLKEQTLRAHVTHLYGDRQSG